MKRLVALTNQTENFNLTTNTALEWISAHGGEEYNEDNLYSYERKDSMGCSGAVYYEEINNHVRIYVVENYLFNENAQGIKHCATVVARLSVQNPNHITGEHYVAINAINDSKEGNLENHHTLNIETHELKYVGIHLNHESVVQKLYDLVKGFREEMLE